MAPMNLGLGLGLSRRVGGGGSTPPSGLPLDGFTPAFAHSSRQRLMTSYTGALIRVRRSSDNTQQDIPYNGSNKLDTTALLSFAGAGSAFVVTVYDQSGNGRHKTNATAAQQPRIVNAGVLDSVNGQAAMFFDGVDDILSDASPVLSAGHIWTFLGVYSSDTGEPVNDSLYAETAPGSANPQLVISIQQEDTGGQPNNDLSHFIRDNAGNNLFNGAAANSNPMLINAIDNTTLIHVAYTNNSGALNAWRNGNLGTSRSYSPSGTFTPTASSIGGRITTTGTPGGTILGYIAEVIGFTTVLNGAQLSAIGSAQGGEYGISVGPFLTQSEAEFAAAFSRDAMFGEFNQNWEGYTGTIASGDRPNSGTVGYPTVMRIQLSALRNEDNKIVASASSLTNFDSWGLGLHLGATAKVFRVINGVMTLVRESTVTGGKIGAWQLLRFQTAGVDDNRIIDGTSFRFNVESFSQPGVPYWFRVSAVGSNGLNGAWSSPVSYTPSAVTGAFNNVPNTPKSFNRTGSGGALPAPTGLAAVQGNAPRVASLTWNAVSGAEGYIVQVAYYDPATEIDETGAYLDLSPHPTPIRSTDFVILENQILTLDDSLICRRTYTADAVTFFKPDLIWFEFRAMNRGLNKWTYVPHTGPKPAGVTVDHFYRTNATPGTSSLMQRFWQGGPAQTGYQYLVPGTTHRVRIIARASEPTALTFTPGGTLTGTTFNLTTDWQEFTHDMPVVTPMTLDSIADWQMTFTGGTSGTDVDVAFFEIRRVGATNNFLASTPPAQNGYLRDHTFIKAGAYNRSLSRLITNPVYGFKQFYDTCKDTNNKPWFQIEWNMPRQEVIDFVAYLAAPNGSHPMADLRLASGIPQPWTTEFPDIKLEWGNEAWQPPNLPDFWGFRSNMIDSVTGVTYRGGLDGDVAGLFWQMISNWMKESPYWSTLAPKLTQHLGGFIGNDFGEEAYRYYQDATEVSIAPYIGGWESGSRAAAETGEAFEVILADAMSKQKPTADARIASLKAVCAATGKTYGTDVRWTIYEGGPGYQLPGANSGLTRIAEEVVMKSRAAATATVDGMLTYAQKNFKNFNFFLVGPGSWWRSHAGAADGSQEYPVHALPRIIHDNISPARVYGAITENIGFKRGRTNSGITGPIEQVGAYQLRNLTDPSKRMIVVVNRNLDPSQLPVDDPMYSATPSGTVAFNVTTTWNSAASLKVWTAGVGPYRQHNRYPVGQRRDASGALVSDPLCVAFDYSSTTVSVPANIKDFAIDASVGATSAGLPAGSCLIMLFEGVT